MPNINHYICLLSRRILPIILTVLDDFELSNLRSSSSILSYCFLNLNYTYYSGKKFYEVLNFLRSSVTWLTFFGNCGVTRFKSYGSVATGLNVCKSVTLTLLLFKGMD